MIDLSTGTIKELFEQQVREMTLKTVFPKEELFDYQFSERWLR